MQQRDPAAALPVAEQIVSMIEGSGSAPGALTQPLHTLAVLQFTQQQFGDAELSFRRAIAASEESGGGYTIVLVPVLRHLAELYYAQSRFDEAEELLRRAQHITHREGGVHDLDQLPIIDSLVAIQLRTGRYRQADQQQRFAYQVSASNFAADDPRILPAMQKLGDWFRLSGQLKQARGTYSEIIQRLRNSSDHSPLEQVDPLRAIAKINYLGGTCCAEERLTEVVEIFANDPHADEQDRVQALLELADMNVVKRNHDEASALYRQAWHRLADVSGDSAVRLDQFSRPEPLGVSQIEDIARSFRHALSRQRTAALTDGMVKVVKNPAAEGDANFLVRYRKGEREPTELIGSPVPLCYPQLMDLVKGHDRERLADFYMDLDFTVSESGRVEQIDVVESNTPTRLRKYVKNLLRAIRFRPRLAEGAPVHTEHVAWHQTFAPRGRETPGIQLQLGDAAMFSGCQLLSASG